MGLGAKNVWGTGCQMTWVWHCRACYGNLAIGHLRPSYLPPATGSPGCNSDKGDGCPGSPSDMRRPDPDHAPLLALVATDDTIRATSARDALAVGITPGRPEAVLGQPAQGQMLPQPIRTAKEGQAGQREARGSQQPLVPSPAPSPPASTHDPRGRLGNLSAGRGRVNPGLSDSWPTPTSE